MLDIKYNIKFRLLPATRADGSHTIRMIVCWKSTRVQCYLPVSAFTDQWDDKRMSAKGTRAHPDVSETNDKITDYFNRAKAVFKKACDNDYIPTKEEVSKALSSNVDDTEETASKLHPIAETIDEFIKDQSKERGWVPITARKFINIKQDLLHAGLKHVEEINAEGMKKLTDYLDTRNLENAVYMKKASVLRWFLNWCRKVGYIDNDNYKMHMPHLKCPQKEVIFLNWEELLQLYHFDYGQYYALDQARDVFCFCAFTGLRYSDAKRLKWSDVRADHISIVTQKTANALKIELNKYSKSIIEKYRKVGVYTPDDLVLPAISIQKGNEHLKDCAMLAQIDEPLRLVSYRGSQRVDKSVLKWEVITTHCARRTFVVNALRLGIPAEVIMKWTGHSDFKAMKPYVAIVDELKKENMARFDLA